MPTTYCLALPRTKNAEYTGEFAGQPNHKVVQWFWDIVRGFEQEQKAKVQINYFIFSFVVKCAFYFLSLCLSRFYKVLIYNTLFASLLFINEN